MWPHADTGTAERTRLIVDTHRARVEIPYGNEAELIYDGCQLAAKNVGGVDPSRLIYQRVESIGLASSSMWHFTDGRTFRVTNQFLEWSKEGKLILEADVSPKSW